MTVFNVLDFKALGDGVTNDAKAIQEAIDLCSKKGGGTVLLPSGYTFYSSSIELKSKVNLHLEKAAMLKAHKDLSTYIRPNQGRRDHGVNLDGTPMVLKPSYAFIYAKDASEISITGEGVIDGNCYAFVKRVSPYYVTSELYPRPTLIYAEHCDHISFKDVILKNSSFWTLHPAGCDDVLIQGIRILNPLDVANSDGIDPDHSTNVRIISCHISCADDAICLKSSAGNMEYPDTANILIADCTLISTSAALKIGTEGTGNFRNILVHDCIISASNRGISIQVRDGGNVENVHFHNILIETRRFADCWWGTAEPIAVTSFDRNAQTASGTISDLEFKDIVCDSENGVLVHGGPNFKVRDLVFENVKVNLKAKSKWQRGLYDLRPGEGLGIEKSRNAGFRFCNVKDLTLYRIKASIKQDAEGNFGEPLSLENCINVKEC